jgi:3-dehydroquinate synthase II
VLIDSHAKEDEAVRHQGKIPVIITNKDWTIIPLENLISKTSNLIQHVHTADEAQLALETMERGADGILLETADRAEIKKVGKLMKSAENEALSLVTAKIVSAEPVGLGDRVVVDTGTLLNPGQGLLVGDSSSALLLVYNENVENPYCAPRPFRVNAGAAHAYIRMPGDTTKYLSELKSGMRALLVDSSGNTETAVIGRIKIERRPMLLVKATAGGKEFTLVLQNAETIRLTAPDGGFISVTKLKAGDAVLAYLQEEGVGRHFGTKLAETIKEQ